MLLVRWVDSMTTIIQTEPQQRETQRIEYSQSHCHCPPLWPLPVKTCKSPNNRSLSGALPSTAPVCWMSSSSWRPTVDFVSPPQPCAVPPAGQYILSTS